MAEQRKPLIEMEPRRDADLHCAISQETKDFLEELISESGLSYGRVVDRLVREEKGRHERSERR